MIISEIKATTLDGVVAFRTPGVVAEYVDHWRCISLAVLHLDVCH